MSKSNIELKEGQKLRISHYRTVDIGISNKLLPRWAVVTQVNRYAGKLFSKFALDAILKKGYSIGTKGGKTVATLEAADGKVIAAGVSICSSEDTFSRKMGNQIATGRLAQMIKDIDVWWFPEVESDIVAEAYTRVERPHEAICPPSVPEPTYTPKKLQWR
jgi:hypothetical protein